MNPTVMPALMMLLKCTLLLAFGWLANWLLRARHSRWRLILWRSLLGFVLLVPVLPLLPLPAFKITIHNAADSPAGSPALFPTAASNPIAAKDKPLLKSEAKTAGANIAANQTIHSLSAPAIRSIPWTRALLLVWMLGAAFASLRLAKIQLQLSHLRRASHQADPILERLASIIRTRLGVRRKITVRVSDITSSPFACGLWRPLILLPQKLVQELPPDEISALLAHEFGHFRRHDLFWCVGWRWMQALLWFHPLVWRIPASHALACEQEADRIASGQLTDRDSYPQLLARMAMRVLELPAVETQLVLNGTAQITQRLLHLKQRNSGVWTWRQSFAAFCLASVLFLVATGYSVSQVSATDATIPAKTEFKTVLAVVQDEDGNPIEGASITPDGYRVKGIHSADAYGWNSKLFGPPEKCLTDKDGKAWLKYPVVSIPDEKEVTGALCFSVYHPEYCTANIQTYYVDSTNEPIQMTRGIPLEVTAYFGADRQPVTDLVPRLGEDGVRPEEWQKMPDGGMAFHKLSPGGHLLLLMGRLPSGEIVFSETQAITAEKGKPCRLALEMKPGIRLEGHVDNRVARPVKNGRVMIQVRPKEYPALTVLEDFYDIDKSYGGREFWHSYRPINEDGSFLFESIPPGEVDVVVLGDGFASSSGGQVTYRDQRTSPMPVPQPFPLTAPATKIEVATEPTATLDFTATTQDGKPIEGVWAGMYSSVFRMRGNFGWNKASSEEPYRTLPELPNITLSGKTDKNGKLVIPNIPWQTTGLGVDHPNYQVPFQNKDFRDRHVRAKYAAGKTNVMVMKMDPKGTDFIGSGGIEN